jgi:acyl-CoA reductase-like NAD-dependent aldehyde dehydrogenase
MAAQTPEEMRKRIEIALAIATALADLHEKAKQWETLEVGAPQRATLAADVVSCGNKMGTVYRAAGFQNCWRPVFVYASSIVIAAEKVLG